MNKPRPNRVKRAKPTKALEVASSVRIKADLSKQAPNNTYSPLLYYEDRKFKCRDCGKREVWTAEQQQWWYEIAKGPVQSTAIRCRACRQARRDAVKGTPMKLHKERRTSRKEKPAR